MVLREDSLVAHKYLFCSIVIIFIFFLLYVYCTDHRDYIEIDNIWTTAFSKAGLSPQEIENISHDGTHWYYKGVSTCVGYGDWDEECPMSEAFCSSPSKAVYGNPDDQATAVTRAIRNNGIHELCPLI